MKESLDVVTEVKELLRRASQVLSYYDSVRGLDFRVAWLYYGSMISAARALGISITDFRAAVSGQGQISNRALRGLLELHPDAYETVIDGSWMMMEMSEAERAELFPKKYPLPLSKVTYINRVDAWRKTQVEKWGAKLDEGDVFPIEAAYTLLRTYVMGHKIAVKYYNYEAWIVYTRGCGIFNAGAFRSLKQANKFRDRIEEGAKDSELYAVALGIIRDYETYCLERAARKAEVDKHVKAQRKIIASKRKEFILALEKRDGLFCQACGSVENLVIDHILPLCDGGFSELENLQLLCRFCNGSKGIRDMDYLERMNKRRKLRNQIAP
ncbi:MAG: HNH endonuclease [Acidobacteriota bacterium]|nr:HNH endonuclease [Acidobacteriota bacterium]MDQ5837353.1 HNH endonuclease [Acidobacteriota bacterium]